MELCWCETLLSEEEFKAALQDADLWQDLDALAAYDNAKDFLALAKTPCPTVVVLQEGYYKLQPLALNLQLPFQKRAAASGWQNLPAPAQLQWLPCPNLLHPQQLLCRELTGRVGPCLSHETRLQQLDSVPFASVERCKLLDVQFVCKELYQHEPQQQGLQQQDVQQQELQQQGWQQGHQQQQQQPTLLHQQHDGLPILEHERIWGDSTAVADPVQQQRPLCKRLSMRVVLQRLPAAPLCDEAADAQMDDTWAQADSSWQQRGLQGCGQVQQLAYTCTLEYPAYYIQSSDYLVEAAAFDSGLRIWQGLRVGDPFSMLWDGEACLGAVQGYRQRKPDDPFFGSPFWSIAVKWDGDESDPKLQPEDWRYGNPWEMTRNQGTAPPPLPDPRHAAATKASRGAQRAPWTAAAAAIAAEAAERTQAKRKRQRQAYHADDFVYETHELAAGDDAAPGDVWDPAEFYYDDDPEDFEADLELDALLQPRRKSARRQDQQQRRGHRYAVHAATAGGSWQHRASAAAPGELTHNYGRDVLVSTDACMVCGSQEGTLITGHAGRTGGNCTRRFHAGCLLLMNAAGIRCVTLAKQAAQQQKRGQAGSGRDGSAAAAAAAAAEAMCDGLLGTLMQQQQQQQQSLQAEQQQQQYSSQPGQQQQQQLSPAVVSAIAAAWQAALRVASGELVLICPSHGCHGCMLNGKQECMVWCCCCWVRAYHHRQCAPHGAEFVEVDGRSFIRCPHCRAAGVPLPGETSDSEAAGVAAAGDTLAARAAAAAAGDLIAAAAAAAGKMGALGETADAAAARSPAPGPGQGRCGGSSSHLSAEHAAMPAGGDAGTAVEQPAANADAAAGAADAAAAAGAAASPEAQQPPSEGSVEPAVLQFAGLHTAGTGPNCSTSSSTHALNPPSASHSAADAVQPARSSTPQQQQQAMDDLQATAAAAAAGAAGPSRPSASASPAPTHPLGSESLAPTAPVSSASVDPTQHLSSESVDPTQALGTVSPARAQPSSSEVQQAAQAVSSAAAQAAQPVSNAVQQGAQPESRVLEQGVAHGGVDLLESPDQEVGLQASEQGGPVAAGTVAADSDVIMIDISEEPEQQQQQQQGGAVKHDVIMIDCSDDTEQEQQQQDQQQHEAQQQEQQQQEQQHAQQQQEQQEQQQPEKPQQQQEQEQQHAMQVAAAGQQQEQQPEKPCTSGCTGSASDGAPETADAGAASAVCPAESDAAAGHPDQQATAAAGDEDLDLLAVVAQLDAQVKGLQHPAEQQQQQSPRGQQQQEQQVQQWHNQQQHDQQQQVQQQHGQRHVASEACQQQDVQQEQRWEQQQQQQPASEQSAGAVQAAVAALCAFGGPAVGSTPASPPAGGMPAWLRLAIEDVERTQPSYMLVPCEAPGSDSSSSAAAEAAAEAAAVLAATAAAAGTLPHQPAAEAAAAAAAGGAAAGATLGLPLSSPHTHWLMGSMAKAEAFFKPANIWGCAIIGVPSCPDDSVYGLAVVLDFLPALQQRQQQLSTLAQQPASLDASASEAAVAAGAAGADPVSGAPATSSVGTRRQANAAAGAGGKSGSSGSDGSRARPLVYLKCNKSVARSGRVQPAWQARDDTERRVQDWQVLVNGNVCPAAQGRELLLQERDVITVQGLSLKLQLVQ